MIEDELRSVLEDQGLTGNDVEEGVKQLGQRINVAGILADLKERNEAKKSAREMTMPIGNLKANNRSVRLPANLRPVQHYQHEYVSAGGQKLHIDLSGDAELQSMVDRAIREIADIREKSKSVLGGVPTVSRLDALAQWVNKKVNYNENIQKKIYDAGGGKAGLGKIVCNGGVCREKSFLVDLMARELGLKSEVWVLNFNDGEDMPLTISRIGNPLSIQPMRRERCL